jgi:hypothetical protein
MAKEIRFSEVKELALMTGVAENAALRRLHGEFTEALIFRFREIKDNIEDWDDAIVNEALLKTRLQIIVNPANNPTYSENNLKDIALLAMFLWNIEEV